MTITSWQGFEIAVTDSEGQHRIAGTLIGNVIRDESTRTYWNTIHQWVNDCVKPQFLQLANAKRNRERKV